ncbi:MAG: protein phosphatase 2C domain-containing protein [Planctomycetota bacterium]
MRISFASLTDVGLVRENNEDNFVVVEVDDDATHLAPPDACAGTADTGGRGVLFAVADGMGGALAGEVASRMAVEAVGDVGKLLQADDDESAARQRILDAIHEVNTHIYESALQNPKQHGMGTTLTVAYVRRGRIQFFQVGDSKGYIARHGKLHAMTKDHSLIGRLVDDKVISPEDAEQLEGGKNIILQALGAEASVKIDYSEAALGGGDVVLLCTDGLHGAFRHRDLEARFAEESKGAEEFCASLVQESKDRGGTDNITGILIAVNAGDAPPPQPGLLGRLSGLLRRKK